MDKNREKVVCKTPTPGKKPTRIDAWKYDIMSQTILKLLPESGDGVFFKDLSERVSNELPPDVLKKLGSVGWYTTTVKLDLECKNKIKRVEGSQPQRLLKIS